MSIKPQVIERLLESDEGVALDFKREQYDFDAASKEAKSELLKDVLAFANASRQADAYILIGVEDKRGARSEVVGVSAHLDDAKLQQFVNTKTQRPVTFSYREATHDGRPIGVLRIPVQPRCIYATSTYGKVEKNAVYVRHGSSTAVASPDEIVRMSTPAGVPAALGSTTRGLDDYEAFDKAPGSGRLAGKLIASCRDTETAERVLEIFRSAPDKRDEVYVDVAWAEFLMAMQDERHVDAMGHIGVQIVNGVYSSESERTAQRHLFPNGRPPDPYVAGAAHLALGRPRSGGGTEAVERLNALRERLAEHIGRVDRGEVTTASIGPGGRLLGECAWARQYFAEHEIFCPELEDANLGSWHDLLWEVAPMLQRGSSMHEIRERAALYLTRSG